MSPRAACGPREALEPDMSDRPKRNAAAPIVIALLVGVMALARFAEGVRSVAVAGLFAGGMAFGAGMMRLILQWRGQLRDER